MGSGRNRALERWFYELYDLDREERKRVLDQKFTENNDLRQELEALLDAIDASTGDILAGLSATGWPATCRFTSIPPNHIVAPEDVALPIPGDRIAQYTIRRKLDQGGMGAVYEAWDENLARLVAIKWLLSTERALVMTEARATARCRHENIVVIHEVAEHDGHPYIVFEYLKGKTLRKWMREQDKPLRLEQVLDIVMPVVRALACAHELDVIHRDLKPENVMLTESGSVKVFDFGIAQMLPNAYVTAVHMDFPESNLTGTQKGIILGTLPYMSPEQWGADDIDHRTDIWAVGILLHELLTRRHPLAPLDAIKLEGVANLDVPMPRLTDVEPALLGIASIINDCLEKRKQNRIGSARELHERLERCRNPQVIPLEPLGDGTEAAPFHETITKLLLSSDVPAPLPARPSREARETYAEALRSRFREYKILYVDDEPTNCDLMKQVLGGVEYENHVVTASDAYEALELSRTHSFDLLLTDLLMPGPSGTALAIQAGVENPDLVVILVTGCENAPHLVESLESPDSPVVDVVMKPWRGRELVRRILEACDKEFSQVLRQAWPDYWATKPVLLQCRRIILGFMHRFDRRDVFQTALRHKMKECVHAYARTVAVGEPGAGAAVTLKTRLTKIERLMERIQIGKEQGLVAYLEEMAQDLVDAYPQIDISIDHPRPFEVLDHFSDIQTLLILSAIELMDNARDALGAQGRIRAKLRERKSTRSVSLKVWCNGPAIPSEIAERIFEEDVSTKGPGQGLGLAVVKAMVTRFGGEIRLLQHDGVAFLVTVPLPEQEDAPDSLIVRVNIETMK